MITDLRITDLCRVLRISGVASCFQELEPTQEAEEIRSFLLQALETEVALRAGRRRLRAIQTAGFPTMKRFDDLDPAMLPDDGRRYLPLLRSLTFLEDSQNILMIGNSGTGKTHLAIATGICACEQEISGDVQECRQSRLRTDEAKQEKRLTALSETETCF